MKNPLQEIPGIGKSIAQDLNEIGIFKLDDLKGKDPEDLYNASCALAGVKIDRCLLYTYRCAVYYASNEQHDPEKLKWWAWRNETPTQRT